MIFRRVIRIKPVLGVNPGIHVRVPDDSPGLGYAVYDAAAVMNAARRQYALDERHHWPLR